MFGRKQCECKHPDGNHFAFTGKCHGDFIGDYCDCKRFRENYWKEKKKEREKESLDFRKCEEILSTLTALPLRGEDNTSNSKLVRIRKILRTPRK